jgi:hypothetical protein
MGGQQYVSVEQTARSNECVNTWACNTICWAVDCLCASFATRVAISNDTGVVWVLTVSQIVVLGVFAAGFILVVGGDKVTKWQGLGCERRGWKSG